jgi:hypothetical protein
LDFSEYSVSSLQVKYKSCTRYLQGATLGYLVVAALLLAFHKFLLALGKFGAHYYLHHCIPQKSNASGRNSFEPSPAERRGLALGLVRFKVSQGLMNQALAIPLEGFAIAQQFDLTPAEIGLTGTVRVPWKASRSPAVALKAA